MAFYEMQLANGAVCAVFPDGTRWYKRRQEVVVCKGEESVFQRWELALTKKTDPRVIDAIIAHYGWEVEG